MSGVEMLLKSFGFDPVQLRELGEQAGKLLPAVVQKLEAIEQRQIALADDMAALRRELGYERSEQLPQLPKPGDIGGSGGVAETGNGDRDAA